MHRTSRASRWLVAAIAAAVVGAGCFGSGSTPPASGAGHEDPGASTDTTPGASSSVTPPADLSRRDGSSDAGTAADAMMPGEHDAGATPDASGTGSTSGATCAAATPLPIDGALAGQSTPASGVASSACRPSDAPQAFYSFTVTAHHRATITVTPTSPFIAVLRVLEGCDATRCVVDEQSDAPGSAVTVTIDNMTDADLPKIVTVSGERASAGGTFTIATRLEPNSDAGGASGDGGSSDSDAGTGGGDGGMSCTVIPSTGALTLGTYTLTGRMIPSTDFPAGLCGRTVSQAEVLTLHLDQRMGVQLSISAGASNGQYIAVRRHCDAATAAAVACSSWYDLGASLIRTQFDPGDYDVVVSMPRPGAGTSYTLRVATFPAIENFTCATAMPVTDGTTLTYAPGDWGGYPGYSCMGDSDAPMPVTYYTTTVPAHTTLTATVSPHPDAPAFRRRYGLAFLTGCTAPRTCLTSQLDYTGLGYTQSWTNTDATAREVVIQVMADTRFNLSVAFSTPPANTTCTSAAPVTDGTTLTAQHAGGSSGTALTCDFSHPGALFYAVTIPPGATLSATATPSGGTVWMPSIALTPGCDGSVCLARGTASSSTPASLTYTNTSGAPLNGELTVSRGASISGIGDFDLAVSVH